MTDATTTGRAARPSADGRAWAESRQTFAAAASWFVATTRQVGDGWAAPGLGEWDVRALVGHTSRSLLTVEEYLGRPAAAVEVESAAEYLRAARSVAAGPGVAARGVAAGEALGQDPSSAVALIAARVLPLVDRADGSELVTTIVGGMRLADYLPTRVFELVVHTLDLTRATGQAAEPPAAPLAAALRLASEAAVAEGSAVPLLLAATGRADLPPGYTVI